MKFVLLVFLAVYLVPAIAAVALWYAGDHPASWRDADWTSARMLPPASASREAAVFVFAARTGGVKGALSEHSWIVVKSEGASAYERWDKVGWGMPVRRNAYPADGRWYSNPPRVVLERHGDAASAVIPAIRRAVDTYPFAMRGGYHIFPGPNSNTFVEHVLRQVPGFRTALPTMAVGRDFPSGGRIAEFDRNRGDLRLSLFGYIGVSAGLTSGLEVNVLGLVAGFDVARLGVKIPAFGTYTLLADRPASV